MENDDSIFYSWAYEFLEQLRQDGSDLSDFRQFCESQARLVELLREVYKQGQDDAL